MTCEAKANPRVQCPRRPGSAQASDVRRAKDWARLWKAGAREYRTLAQVSDEQLVELRGHFDGLWRGYRGTRARMQAEIERCHATLQRLGERLRGDRAALMVLRNALADAWDERDTLRAEVERLRAELDEVHQRSCCEEWLHGCDHHAENCAVGREMDLLRAALPIVAAADAWAEMAMAQPVLDSDECVKLTDKVRAAPPALLEMAREENNALFPFPKSHESENELHIGADGRSLLIPSGPRAKAPPGCVSIAVGTWLADHCDGHDAERGPVDEPYAGPGDGASAERAADQDAGSYSAAEPDRRCGTCRRFSVGHWCNFHGQPHGLDDLCPDWQAKGESDE